MLRQTIYCIFLFLLSSDTFTAKVIGVTDGDTIVVLTSDKKQIRIRLEGICISPLNGWTNNLQRD
jgi:endonuclease YncB( thermonuclease family)